MNRRLKRFLFVLLGVVAIFWVSVEIAEYWLTSKFIEVINRNQDRTYDITFKDLDLHLFLRGIDLHHVRIAPVNFQDSATTILGDVRRVDIDGVKWKDLMASRKVNISKVIFYKPEFTIALVDGHRERRRTGKDVQQLFGDILSRAFIREFRISHGYTHVKRAGDPESELSHVYNFNIVAKEIVTDSLQWTYPVPFKLGSFEASIDSFSTSINEYTGIKGGRIAYHSDHSDVSFSNIRLYFLDDWRAVNRQIGDQIDLIAFDLKNLTIRDIEANSDLYGDLDIRAGALVIDGLDLRDHRDKNLPRPPDVEMPMFKGMIDKIPVSFKLDSIILQNSNISYAEVAEGKDEPGIIEFNDIHGSIVDITTIPDYRSRFGDFHANLSAKLNKQGLLSMALTVPYDREAFDLDATIKDLELLSINETVLPMLGIEGKSGVIELLHVKMHAGRTESGNQMVMNYRGLDIAVAKETDQGLKEKHFLSTLANSAIRTDNLPDQKNYIAADYFTERNIYRGPFNFIWQGMKHGFMTIIPTEAAKVFIGANSDVVKVHKEERKAERERKREEKKHQKEKGNN